MGAAEAGLTASSDQVMLTYGGLVGGPNHDCPDAAAPAGVESLTIAGHQVTSTGATGTGLLTLCIPRPDQLAAMPLSLGTNVKLVDVSGDVDTCHYEIERTRPVSGSASSHGMCGNGTDPAGFELVIDGGISLTRTCAGVTDIVAVRLLGTIAVARQ